MSRPPIPLESKMDPQVKVALLGALRSGDFLQGRNSLRREGNRYCCLGVLCEVLGVAYKAASALPNRNTRRLAGITESQAQYLAGLNDLGRSFEQIADTIETEF